MLLERHKRPGRAASAIAAAVVALVCVFAALAASVVDARKPLDGQVARSFRAVAPALGGITTVARSPGCTKTSVDWYYCPVEVRGRRSKSGETVYYQMLLQDDGCWNAAVLRPIAAKQRYPALHGCIPAD